MKYPYFLKTMIYKRHILFLYMLVLLISPAISQSEAYKQKRIKQLAGPSPFQREIDGKLPERVLFHDSLVTVLDGLPGAGQAPIHLLAIPNVRIPSLNEMQDKDSYLIGHMLWALKNQARRFGIDNTGYRISLNTGEDAGQSAFHIHAHLLGGTKTGPMSDPGWRNIQRARNAIKQNAYVTEVTKDENLVKMMGIWFSDKENTNHPAVNIILRIEPELAFNFTRISYTRDVVAGKDSGTHYESVSIITPAKNHQYIGNGYDSDRNIFTLDIVKDATSTLLYFLDHEGKATGKISLRILDTNSLQLVVSTIDKNGQSIEIVNQQLIKNTQF